MITDETHYLRFASCFQRGRCGIEIPPDVDMHQFQDFKRSNVLPRARKILGYLQSLYPKTLLDVGYGRGAFLYPLMEAMPHIEISVLDNDPYKITKLEYLKNGGLNIHPIWGDIAKIPAQDNSFYGVTALEVLEHVPDPGTALRELVRVARQFVLISVPSKPDNNTQHIRLITKEFVSSALPGKRITCEWVLGHMLAMIR